MSRRWRLSPSANWWQWRRLAATWSASQESPHSFAYQAFITSLVMSFEGHMGDLHTALALALAKGCDLENDWMTWGFCPTCLHCLHSLKMRKKPWKAYMSSLDEPKASVSPKQLAAMISNLLLFAVCCLTYRYLLINTNTITISSTNIDDSSETNDWFAKAAPPSPCLRKLHQYLI